MERPERVLAEIARVLRPGTGRFAMTAWAPEGDLFTLVGQAVQAHANMAVPLPAAPSFFRSLTRTRAGPPSAQLASRRSTSKASR
ncbi:class I SAM-dependent methyltransferase [Roseococcus sp. MDT2-1-1]|uniref:Class I SAM-dependent methyltransferase n=2 Tax=Sabulicella glaciei TaxID=2984948 RepID=A0ABT3NWN0_9PROT|nr:hypothetical protein [Roseococcus sp. MDT2-1-1]MCW8086568.1 class I SAM-dependent methyltransferase [Roseococcus sp. MDT2-1-1]